MSHAEPLSSPHLKPRLAAEGLRAQASPQDASARATDTGRPRLLDAPGGVSASVVAGTSGGVVGAQRPGLVYIETRDTNRRWRACRRTVLSSAAVISEFLQDKGFRHRVAMVTLTYGPQSEWSPNHIRSFLKLVREWARRRGITVPYVWKLELTAAGVPHYHVLLWLPKGYTVPKPDKQGWWRHGSTRCEWARRAVAYAAKYCAKSMAGDLPIGARLYGVGGVGFALRWRIAGRCAPVWLRDLLCGSGVRRRSGGWWQNVDTGFAYRSPWVLDSWSPGGMSLRWVGWQDGDVFIPGTGVEPWQNV